MNNKTKTYLLIIAVLSIWGTIGYKILNGLNPEDSTQDLVSFDPTFKPKTTVQKDTFSIQIVDKDPFLGTLTKVKTTTVKKGNVKPKITENVPQPRITYQGLVTNKQNTSNQIFTVTINNQQYLFKKGQTIDNVTLVRGNIKEIVVSYNGGLKTISIQ